jgi:hypothetical protein
MKRLIILTITVLTFAQSRMALGALGAPTNLTAAGVSPTQINLSWTDNATNEKGYQVFRSTDGITFTQIAVLPFNSKAYTDRTVSAATTYFYRVRCYISIPVTSSYSNIGSATTALDALVAPTNLTAAGVSPTQINLSWTDNATNENTYQVFRSTDEITFTQIAVLPFNSKAYTDRTVSAAIKYFYRVRCYISIPVTYSSYSNIGSATTKANEVWIAIRTDGLPGLGTQADPYNGSTAAKFDALMTSFQYIPNLGIHLVGPGPFRTYAGHTWFVHSGWVISGDGMNSTTIQMVGSAAGLHYDVDVFESDPNLSTDNVTIKNLTIDCNWAELSQTADTGPKGEKNIKTGGIILWGSNNLIDHVYCINSYGSFEVGMEEFTIMLAASRFADATNDVIQYCRVESPQGTHMAPFGLSGWNSTLIYLITNSKVIGCTAVGVNNGLGSSFSNHVVGFGSGGVNMANVKDVTIDGNTFIDCLGAAYIDTGSCDGVTVTNNTVIRGWDGVGFGNSTLPRQNILVRGNNINIQNRVISGIAGCGILMNSAATTSNATIDSNTVTFDTAGAGTLSFYGIVGLPLNTAQVTNNTLGIQAGVHNQVDGTGITKYNNRYTNGTPVPGL